jgi:hypothetical protein
MRTRSAVTTLAIAFGASVPSFTCVPVTATNRRPSGSSWNPSIGVPGMKSIGKRIRPAGVIAPISPRS